MLRLILCIGDQPENGGYIVPMPAGVPHTIMGHPIAFIGGQAFCDACKHMGVIAKAGGPRRRVNCGVEVALDKDILLCQCPTPPKMLARMQSMSRHDDLSETMGTVGTGDITQRRSIATERCFDEQFTLRHQQTGQPLRNLAYRIRTSAGQTVSGMTDAQGRTQRITTNGAHDLQVEIAHRAKA
jgi:uncharacterized Zn-binding protein involved in type VI secretion